MFFTLHSLKWSWWNRTFFIRPLHLPCKTNIGSKLKLQSSNPNVKIFSLIFFSSSSKNQTSRQVRPNHLCTSYTIAKMRNRELRLYKNPNFPHHCTTEGSFGFLQKYIGSYGLVRTPIVHIFYYLGSNGPYDIHMLQFQSYPYFFHSANLAHKHIHTY